MANDAVRRIMAEVRELSKQTPDSLFVAAPLDNDLFEWHFSVRGPPDTAFEGGVYHGRIVLPAEYPLKAPEIMLLTPNGRFELNVPICLSVTSHHQETWQPSWGIRTILTALIGFMPSPAEGLGSLDFPDSERRKLARKSHSYVCPRCGVKPIEQLPPLKPMVDAKDNSVGNRNENSTASAGQTCSKNASSSSSDGSSSNGASSSSEVPTTPAQSPAVNARPAQSPRPRARPRRRNRREAAQDTALLYATYAILALIVGIVLRRFL